VLSQLAALPAPSALGSLTCRQRHWLALIFKAHPALQRLLLKAQYLARDGRHLAIREKPERRQLEFQCVPCPWFRSIHFDSPKTDF
tara:strand:- start:267 stop:524 length:258 start_codon:yes stop_codon:yes gene_type:complete